MKTIELKRNHFFYISIIFIAFSVSTQIYSKKSSKLNKKKSLSIVKTKEHHLDFNDAEKILLKEFQKDLPKIAEITKKIAIYRVKGSSKLNTNFSKELKGKIEEIITNDNSIKLKKCSDCNVGVITQNVNSVTYSFTPLDPVIMQKIAKNLAIEYFFNIEVIFDSSDLIMKVQVIRARDAAIHWTKNYSVAEISGLKSPSLSRERKIKKVPLVLGETRFKTTLSLGMSFIPSIKSNSGSSSSVTGSVPITGLFLVNYFMGEIYDQGYREFGFNFGALFSLSPEDSTNPNYINKGSRPVSFAAMIGPQMKWIRNPNDLAGPIKTIIFDVGGFIGSGFATAFIGLGYELKFASKFSIMLEPFYIIDTKVKKSTIYNETEVDSGNYSNATDKSDTLGGIGYLLKAVINW